ncbi:MAG: phosphate ABC transporter permease subunit PstC [Oscillospiraceae bacterium]|nr:phosphate ABC transporter permease subunit PstC [Oscillospiraceae bacterium]MDD4369001.1 phosphate ABC transporter permease subunit PstC [Oscillospiraceae bacterium]
MNDRQPNALKLQHNRQRRDLSDKIWRALFLVSCVVSALMIVLIIIFIAVKGIRVFLPGYEYGQQNFWDFLTGMTWRQDSQTYGVGFIVVNTFTTAAFAALLSFPVATLTALFIVKIAPKQLRVAFTTVIELLAAIPSVVYGVFASGAITKLVQRLADFFGQTSAAGISALSVILLLAIMIFPTICSMAIVAIQAVGKSLEWGSLALGASQTQTNFKVVLSAAKSGIFAGLVLGLGRAFGEATAVTMVAGNAMSGPSWNLFDTTRTLTTTMLSGMHETSGLDYDIRFSAGLILMAVILLTNALIHLIKRKVGGVGNE